MSSRRSRPSLKYPLAAAAAVAAVLSVSSRAAACGGLFCSNSNPVNQTAERIVFASDGDGNITCVVEIQYEGPSESFSWVLPVPGEPEVSVSSTAALDQLQRASAPVYQIQTDFGPGCNSGPTGIPSLSASGGDNSAEEGGIGVDVVASGSVGPYDYEVIRVDPTLDDPADVAVTWFEDNGYDMPPNGRETLRPYLADRLNLIGFRLTKSATAGSIRPVILRYRSEVPMIPIRPTAVAATEDMGVLVWVLGSSRAVPVNYRTLELNDSLIDWFNPTDTYDDVVIAAANEAGGQGFVTEQSGAAIDFADAIWAQGQDPASFLQGAAVNGAPALLTEAAANYGSLDGFADVVRETVTLRDGWTAEAFTECAWCYYDEVGIDPYQLSNTTVVDPTYDTDAAAFLAALDTDVIQPMVETRQLFEEHSYVTRMYTTLSADEMTVDPTFDFNTELEDVDNVHVATRTVMCSAGDTQDPNNSWTMTLPSGLTVQGSGTEWPFGLADGELPANLRVLQLSTSGQGEVIDDNREVISEQLSQDGGGCACRTSPRRGQSAWTAMAVAGLLGLGLRRRRRLAEPRRRRHRSG